MTGIASEADKRRFQECPGTLRARFSLCSGNSRCRVRGSIGQSPDFPDFPPEIMEDESQSVNRNECSFAFFILKIIRTGLPSCFFRLLLVVPYDSLSRRVDFSHGFRRVESGFREGDAVLVRFSVDERFAAVEYEGFCRYNACFGARVQRNETVQTLNGRINTSPIAFLPCFQSFRFSITWLK